MANPLHSNIGRRSLATLAAMSLCVMLLAGCDKGTEPAPTTDTSKTEGKGEKVAKGENKKAPSADKPPLKIIYSDWPGWVAWQVAIEKDFFKDEGVETEFIWMDYVKGMDAFAAGQADAHSITNGDALVIGATANKPSTAIIINDYSNGNDMLIAAPGIEKIEDLKGKKIGVELGFVGHLLTLTALESVGLEEKDVELVNIPTNETPQALAAGGVSAIAAWQPPSGQALKTVSGSKAVFTSAQAPGIIYDLLCVSQESLASRKDDWAKVVKVWYRTVAYIKDPKNKEEVLKILSGRVKLSPEEYEPLLGGTYLLSLDEAIKVWEGKEGLESLTGSFQYVDSFNVKYEVYKKPEFKAELYMDPSLTKALVK